MIDGRKRTGDRETKMECSANGTAGKRVLRKEVSKAVLRTGILAVRKIDSEVG